MKKIVEGPTAMIMIPPRSYCVISNPVVRDETGAAVADKFGNVKVRWEDEEIRFEQEPFPLYPGEKLVGKITPLTLLNADSALLLRCIRDFKDEKADKQRVAGDEWLFTGTTYHPRVEVKVVELRNATVLKPNQALRLRGKKDCTDFQGVPRKAGEEWLVRKTGSYLPGVEEEVVGVVQAEVLTEKRALHLRALKTFKDVFGKKRKAGEEWLVTFTDAETHIPDVYEEVVGKVNITTLSNRQYCVILDPIDEKGHQHFGKRELKRGESSFFLRPGERLESGIQNVHILGEEEALLLRARIPFTEGKVEHPAGDLWMLRGPCEYVPPVNVEIVENRTSIALDENEGIYVRDRKTGKVREVVGQTYMLSPNEELWAKELPASVEELLSKTGREPGTGKEKTVGTRDKTRVVTYRAPHNSAVQVYDYTAKQSRIVFGPELVMLKVNEEFTVLTLSGGVPKVQNKIKSLALLLGPDFTTDIVIVETSDHARLSLRLSYNWHFDVASLKDTEKSKIFSVPDFVGDACKAIASRVRGAVAAVSFDSFHKNSADIIKAAVFGTEEDGSPRNSLKFNANNLVITNIDIQSVEPVDQRTKDSLQKSVQLAIEITTKSQEASARRDAERAEQEAKGRLERQKLEDESKAESAKKKLLELQAESAVVEASGQAKAEAKAKSEATLIEAEAEVKQSILKADSLKIQGDAELEQLALLQRQEREHLMALNQLEVQRAKELASIEAKKFRQVVEAIGADTICDIAQAGPQLQAQLLEGLGLKSFLITDGSSPINLFNTAQGLIGGAQ